MHATYEIVSYAFLMARVRKRAPFHINELSAHAMKPVPSNALKTKVRRVFQVFLTHRENPPHFALFVIRPTRQVQRRNSARF